MVTEVVSEPAIKIYSEVGTLKKVLLHKPGAEIENITPELMERLLFDDIPYLEVARQEHDYFADILRTNGTEVIYLIDLLTDLLVEPEIRQKLVDDYLNEAGIIGRGTKAAVRDYLKNFDDAGQLADKMISGIYQMEVKQAEVISLADAIKHQYPFVVDPLPNTYFTRDPAAAIGRGLTVNRMRTRTRNRESLFIDYLANYHPMFANQHLPKYYQRRQEHSIEGGDILILSDKLVAVGLSERTDVEAIEKLADCLLDGEESFETVLAFDIPNKRAFMHLDTVFTMVDRDAFTIHPEIEGILTVYAITKQQGRLKFVEQQMALADVLRSYLGLERVRLIHCGDGHPVNAAREQWNDGSNTLAISPGHVVVYSRNYVTNKKLEEAGIHLHVMPSSELSRGRGGPRCMSMPLYREG